MAFRGTGDDVKHDMVNRTILERHQKRSVLSSVRNERYRSDVSGTFRVVQEGDAPFEAHSRRRHL